MSDAAHDPLDDVYQLRVVIAGVSPLIWRRLDVPATTTVAGLHTVVQTVFGWSRQHLHRFVIQGTDFGIGYLGGPGFRDDTRQVRLADLGLRPGERFGYEYNFVAAWRVDLRLKQIVGAQPGPYPCCSGGRRAGPPEDWTGPGHLWSGPGRTWWSTRSCAPRTSWAGCLTPTRTAIWPASMWIARN
jgi:hypothetical protein